VRARARRWGGWGRGRGGRARRRGGRAILQSLTGPCGGCGGSGHVWTPATLIREIERAVRRAGVSGKDRQILIRAHPQVALQIMEFEPRFVRRLSRDTRLRLDIRDDPLMRPDDFRLLAGRAEEDVTDRYRSG